MILCTPRRQREPSTMQWWAVVSARTSVAMDGIGSNRRSHQRRSHPSQCAKRPCPPHNPPRAAARPRQARASGAAGGRDALRARSGVRPSDRAPPVPLRSPPPSHEPADPQMRGGRARAARGFAGAASPWGDESGRSSRQTGSRISSSRGAAAEELELLAREPPAQESGREAALASRASSSERALTSAHPHAVNLFSSLVSL